MVTLGVTNFPNGLNAGTSGGGSSVFQIGGTTVVSTAADLNRAAGQTGTYFVNSPTSGLNVAVGLGTVTGSANFATGLAGVITAAVAGNAALNAGGGTTQGFLICNPIGTFGGSVAVSSYDAAGVFGTAATVVRYIAWGTA